MNDHIDRDALLEQARVLAFRAAVGVLLALALLGHTLVLLAGAADALLTAYLGVPRLSSATRRFVEVVRDTWEEER